MDNLFIFPPPFVWYTEISNHEEIKKKYLPLLNEEYLNKRDEYNEENYWDCSVTSSFHAPNYTSCTFLDDYFWSNVLWGPMDRMLDQVCGNLNIQPPINSRVSKVWWNKYKPGEWQEVHTHKSEGSYAGVFSGIYLIESDEEDPVTSFVNNQTFVYSSPIQNYETFKAPVKEGCVILFPSEVMHYVNPCTNPRTTVSFNISSKLPNPVEEFKKMLKEEKNGTK